MKRFILMLASFLLVQGCSHNIASTGPFFKAHAPLEKNKAAAYFFHRGKDSEYITNCLLVKVDGQNQGCLGYPGFVLAHVQAGEHKMAFVPDALIKLPANLTFRHSFKAGHTYYFELRRLTSNAERKIALKYHYNLLLEADYGWFLVDIETALEVLPNLREWA